MTFNIKDCLVEVRVQNIQIEADSEEEALRKLSEMSLDDFSDYGYVDDISVKDVDYEVTEYDFDAKVTNIEYDIDDDEPIDTLPKELTVKVRNCDDEINESKYVEWALEDETGHLIKSFDYEVIKKY